MTAYRVLCFRNSILEEWEALETDDLLEAIMSASRRAPDFTVELWSDKGRIAQFRPMGQPSGR